MKELDKFLFEKLKISDDSEYMDSNDKKNWKVGDIVVAEFHWSMTLVDFYEITKTTGKTFTMKKLKQKIVSGNGQEGKCEPIKGEYEKNEPEVRARINKYGYVKIRDYYCDLWNGDPVYFSHLD